MASSHIFYIKVAKGPGPEAPINVFEPGLGPGAKVNLNMALFLNGRIYKFNAVYSA